MAEDALPLAVTDESAAPAVAGTAELLSAAPEAPVEQAPAAVAKPQRRKPAQARPAAAAPAPVIKPKRKPAAKAHTVATPTKAPVIKAKSARNKPASLPKTVVKAKPAARLKSLSEILPMTTDFTATIKTALADVQGKAKAAYAKGSSSLAEGAQFAKGNAEAVVESGKILAEGLQKLGSEFVAESKGAFDTLTAEAKELAAVKTPTDFFKLQGDLMRKHFDAAVAFGSKQTEAMVKLSTESMAPISRRVTLAMEAIKKAA